MDERKDLFGEELCEEEDCVSFSLDDVSDEDLDQLWDEADEDELDMCASGKCRKKKKLIIAAVAIAVIAAVTAIVVYKICKKSKSED